MAHAIVADLVAALAETRVLDAAQAAETARLVRKGFAAPRVLAKELVARGWISTHQANHLVQGRLHELLFGPYLILDKLGEGGMGTVLKARHVKSGRLVALKVIKKAYLSRGNAAERFRREIEAAAQLNHPNIVMALASDTFHDAHYYAMEYVEGIDLRRLLHKKAGPLPVTPTCDFIRQAALGLQHAWARGLVHRDIKPSNLMVTRKAKTGQPMGPWGLVKILDMGLARAMADADVDWSGALTRHGAVVGTPDYIAPEQARDARVADVRSDIYSLGCSFYHLLTNSVPFPGGTGMEKIFRHQLEPLRPVREHRPEVPAPVQAVIHKMMAKKPADRFQTPLEVARALARLVPTRLPR